MIQPLTSININPTWLFRLTSVTDDFRTYSFKTSGIVGRLKYRGFKLCGL